MKKEQPHQASHGPNCGGGGIETRVEKETERQSEALAGCVQSSAQYSGKASNSLAAVGACAAFKDSPPLTLR